jgi:hypothetical protein
MRSWDSQFVEPALREYGLLKMNKDGVFMTRSLAENYPYSKLYKAAIRGARNEWLDIVDLIEMNKLDPLAGLKFIIILLLNRSETFKKEAESTLSNVVKATEKFTSLNDAIDFIKEFVDESTYSARIFEISMHSLFQVLEDMGAIEGFLAPLSQMRSANKKHGNIGDIEITSWKGGSEIVESWDAKYGKPYLRDELEELDDKLRYHHETETAGFVVDSDPNLKGEIIDRIEQLGAVHNTKVKIFAFKDWSKEQAKRAEADPKSIGVQWILAFAESLCQKRRERAPIDEPSDIWVIELGEYAKRWLSWHT